MRHLPLLILLAGCAPCTPTTDHHAADDDDGRKRRRKRDGWREAIATLPSDPPADTDQGDLPAPAKVPRVILVTLDTVRASHTHTYGHPTPNTPHLDALAATGTVYGNAFATSGWTLPSHTSLFTGQWPTEHRTHKFKAVGADGEPVMIKPALDDSALTLAEHLQAKGYATGAFAANSGYLDAVWNLDQGFDRYTVKRIRGTDLAERALRFLDRHADQPSFVFLNVMEAHTPYTCDASTGLGPCEVRWGKRLSKRVSKAVTSGQKAEHADTLTGLERDYVRGIAAADLAVGHLLDGLRTRGWLDDALVVVTSDHGESFGDHDHLGHGRDVWDHLIRIPMVVKAPGQEARTDDDAVTSLAHLPKIMLDHLGTEAPEAFTKHWPRTEAVAEAHYVNARMLDVDDYRYDRIRQAVVADGWKLFADNRDQATLVPLTDKDETVDRSEAEPERRAALEAMLPGFEVGDLPSDATRSLALEGELEALGYVE